MNADFDRDDLRSLFEALHDGTISPGEHTQLERTLAGSAEAPRLHELPGREIPAERTIYDLIRFSASV